MLCSNLSCDFAAYEPCQSLLSLGAGREHHEFCVKIVDCFMSANIINNLLRRMLFFGIIIKLLHVLFLTLLKLLKSLLFLRLG